MVKCTGHSRVRCTRLTVALLPNTRSRRHLQGLCLHMHVQVVGQQGWGWGYLQPVPTALHHHMPPPTSPYCHTPPHASPYRALGETASVLFEWRCYLYQRYVGKGPPPLRVSCGHKLLLFRPSILPHHHQTAQERMQRLRARTGQCTWYLLLHVCMYIYVYIPYISIYNWN